MTILSLHLYLPINEYDEYVVCLNERMFSSAMYMKDYSLSMFYVLSFIFQHYMPVHVHGAICPYVGDSSVLFAGRRVGEVIIHF